MVKSYEQWMYEVNSACDLACGLSVDDLPDYCFRDAYDSGKSPKSVAKSAIRSAKEYY